MTRTLSTLIYVLHEGQVLLQLRRKEPNLGQWTAPGGKLEPCESPAECACRELTEETGLAVTTPPELRLIITESSPRPEDQWLMFVYLVRSFSGEVQADLREGELAWTALDDVLHLAIPQADRIFYPLVVDNNPAVRSLKFEYDADLKLQRWRIE
ncbi:MAG: 8-oxo-dGTP diphosphatase [Caldilineales bacterium]